MKRKEKYRSQKIEKKGEVWFYIPRCKNQKIEKKKEKYKSEKIEKKGEVWFYIPRCRNKKKRRSVEVKKKWKNWKERRSLILYSKT